MGSGTATRRAGAPLPNHRCPAGKLLTAGLSKRSPASPFTETRYGAPRQAPADIFIKPILGRATAAPQTGPAPPQEPPRNPGGTLPPNAPSPGQRGVGRPPPLRLRAVPADGRAAAGEAPSSPHLPIPSPLPPRASPAGAGGRPALASRGSQAPLGSGARRFPGMRPPRGRAGVPEMARDNGERGGTGGGSAGSAVHRHHPSCPLPPGRRGGRCPSRELRLREAHAHGAVGVAAEKGVPDGQSPPPPRPPCPPAAGEALTLPNHLFRRGRGRRDGGCGGRKSVGGGGFAWPFPRCEEHGEAWGLSRPRASRGSGRQAGAEGRWGGTGEVPEPWAPPSSASSKPQGLKHAHTPPPRNLYTAQ